MKVGGRLADYLEAKSSGGLLGDIRAFLIAEADKPTDRRQDCIHPSEMAHHDWCPRATYYRIRDARAGIEMPSEKHKVGTLAIFDEGHSIHAKWQGWLRKMRRLKGRWDCSECGRRGVAWGEDPGQCPECGSKSGVVYGEVPLNAYDQTLISGHADGWVDDAFIEIKSIGKGTIRIDDPELLKRHTHTTTSGKKLEDVDGLWNDLSRPLPSHVRQANVYLWLAKLLGIPVSRMIFLYEFKANQQTKSFEITLSERILTPLREKAESIKIGLETGTPPDREFGKPDKNPCKSCHWLKECYAEDSEDSSGESRGNVRTGSARRRSQSRPSRRNGVGRPRADEPFLGNERVGELSRNAPRTGSGQRKVRRVKAGNSAGAGGSE